MMMARFVSDGALHGNEEPQMMPWNTGGRE